MSVKWTPELDAMLKRYWAEKLQCYQVAEIFNVSPKAVQGRANRLGIFFERSKTRRQRPVQANGHKPFDERSAELLRAAGVRI
jgi:hypothetical protein